MDIVKPAGKVLPVVKHKLFLSLFEYVLTGKKTCVNRDSRPHVFLIFGNILLKLKGQVNTQMSSVAHNWTANRAIDGRVGPDPDTCHCCSGTENSQLSWWKLDLSQKISIKSIVIYSRDEESYYQHLKGFRLYLTNNTAQDSSAINTNTNTNITGNAYEINVPNTLARYVTIKRPGVLTICEVMIFEGECRMGTYGEECMKECHCADNKPCNKESGQCQTLICKTGWKGTACDQGCPQDRFGDGCKERCFCAEDTCTTSYGACPGNCRQGYHGPHCNIGITILKSVINDK
ncbi:uncharacterized protein LOC128554967 [Mercenaria mercenaria]|uniref:uncharacterized protein LOC128554967 n=1 Tax=Mercenaria mercenaria TaxID=6596 RepID=UPI00234F7F7B|nr:uncharacterized protein LOC128554967 [Mercenaria mercenaria]